MGALRGMVMTNVRLVTVFGRLCKHVHRAICNGSKVRVGVDLHAAFEHGDVVAGVFSCKSKIGAAYSLESGKRRGLAFAMGEFH